MFVMVIDDNVRLATELRRACTSTRIECAYSHSDGFLAQPARALDAAELLLVNALSVTRNEGVDDPLCARSLAVGVEIASVVKRLDGPPIIVYSSKISVPAVAVPLHEMTGTVAARYRWSRLQEDLKDAVGGTRGAAEPPPSPSAYESLGIGPRARLAAAIACARSRADVWSWVWDLDRVVETRPPRTRAWVLRNLRPLLDNEGCTAADAISVLRRTAGAANDPFVGKVWV